MRHFGRQRRYWRWKNRRSLAYVFLRHVLMEEVVDEDRRPDPVHVVEHNGCGAEIYVSKTRWGRDHVLRLGRYQLVGKSLVLVEYVSAADIPDLQEVLLKAQRWLNAPPSRRRNGRAAAGQGQP